MDIGMDERRLWSMGYFFEQGKAWFIAFHTNDLYEWNLETGRLSWIDCFPFEESRFKSHPICVKWKNEIFAFPDMGEDVWVYHMETKEFSKISIGKRRAKRYESRSPMIQGDDIWFPVCGRFGVFEPQILHINARTHQYRWSGSIMEGGLCVETVYKDGYIYLASSQDNILYRFDTERNRCNAYCVEELNGGIETVCDVGKELWLSDHTGRIACWDTILQQTTREAILPFRVSLACRQKMNSSFLQSRCVNGRVCYIPAYANPLQIQEAVMFEAASLSIQKVPFISPKDVEGNYILVEFVTDDGKIGIWTEKSNSILLLDTKQGHIVEKRQVLSKKDSTLLWMRSHPGRSTETAEWDISSFVDIIKDRRLQFRKKEGLGDRVGTEIYRTACL